MFYRIMHTYFSTMMFVKSGACIFARLCETLEIRRSSEHSSAMAKRTHSCVVQESHGGGTEARADTHRQRTFYHHVSGGY